MSKKESRSSRLFQKFGLSKQETSKREDEGRRRDGQAAPSPVVPRIPSQTAKDDPFSTTIELNNQKIATSLNLPASSAQGPAAEPSAEYPPLATAINPSTKDATSVYKNSAIPTPPEQLWDEAYDTLKHDEPKLFKLYESILSRELDSSKDAKGNVIEQNREKRRSQMDYLLDTGLEKTAKLINVEKNIGDTINIVLSVKEAVGSAIQAVPIAALAWTGVCVALQASYSSDFTMGR
jgi:N-terminal domain of NWD NACHT-NTPase